MKNILVVFIFIILVISCKKEFELGSNFLDSGDDIVLFESVSFENYNVGYKNVRVSFNPVLLENLNETQLAKISGYIIYKNGAQRFIIKDKDPSGNFREWFYDTQLKNGSNVCYALGIKTDTGVSKTSKDFCIDVP